MSARLVSWQPSLKEAQNPSALSTLLGPPVSQ